MSSPGLRSLFRFWLGVTFYLALTLPGRAQTLVAGGAVQVQEVGTGLKISGELGKVPALTYKVKFAEGKTYVIDMISADPKALDPFLRLLNAYGWKLVEDDNGGEGLNARIVFQAKTAGIYQVVATFIGKGNGPFTLSVQEATKEEVDKSIQIGLANQLNAKAVALHRVGKTQEAIGYAGQALTIRREVLGEKHSAYAQSLNNLAVFYEAQGNYAKAEPLHWQAMAIRKEVLGEKHPDYALSLNNLAALYEAQGNYAKAEPLFRQALEIRKEVLGEKHPDYALSLNNLAAFYVAQGNYANAEPLFRQALEIHKEVLGEKHPDYAVSLNNLAFLYDSQGNYTKAEPLYRQALEICQRVLGEKHPTYATSLNNLASLYKSQGNYAKAEPLFRKAMEIRQEVLGEKHPDFAQSLNNLATLYYSQGDHGKAEPLYRQALEIRKEVLGEKHPDYATCLNNLAGLYDSQGSYAKAEPLFRKALEIRQEVLGEKHPDYATSLNNLAGLYHSQGNYAKAEPLFRQALEIKKEVLGDKHPDYATSLNNLALLYNLQRNHAKAEPLYRQALDIRREVLGEKHPAYVRSLNNLAAVYKSQGNYAKAEPLSRQSLAASQITSNPIPFHQLPTDDFRIHPDTVRILQNYALFTRNQREQMQLPNAFPVLRSFLSLGLAVLDRVRQENLDHQESKIQLTAKRFDLFPFRIKVLSQLFALEKKSEDLEAVFSTVEQGTARTFLESLGISRANFLAGISPSCKPRRSNLLQDIRLLDLRLDKESARALDKRDPALIGQLFEQRRDAEKNLKELVVQLEKEYPQYAALKYPQPCKLEEARACLAPDEVALLFVAGTKAYCMVLVEARQPKRRTSRQRPRDLGIAWVSGAGRAGGET